LGYLLSTNRYGEKDPKSKEVTWGHFLEEAKSLKCKKKIRGPSSIFCLRHAMLKSLQESENDDRGGSRKKILYIE